ncbi:hypothetical protein KY360_02685 [Candidatus Woesearchaeota archaeon]|nr:hypothetical protein [Candidatus Woesearchaeota archaeon]
MSIIFSRRRPHHEKFGSSVADSSAKIHQVRVKSKGGRWKSVRSIHQITMHDVVRLADKPHIEGEVRHIDEEKKRVEFNHLGRPVFAPINKIKVRVKKEYKRL